MAETMVGTLSQNTQGYAGDITPAAAWEGLQASDATVLIDVRTPPEWTFAGYPDLSSLAKKPVLLSWRMFPAMQVNDAFLALLEQAVPDKAAPLYFLCRTGGRSREAAMVATAAGYSYAYNIEDGFEGPLDEEQRRGRLAGWRAAALPWRQE